MRNRSIKIILIICMLSFFHASTTSKLHADFGTTKDKVIKIGALLCLTGACAEWGQAALNGMKIAQREVNLQGGINGKRLELVIQDSSEETPSKAVAGYKQLRSFHNVQFIVGPSWTPAGLALAPIVAKEEDVIMISPSLGIRDFNETADNLFNVWPHDEVSTRFLARFAYEKGWRSVAIFSSQQPWELAQGKFFQNEFISLGGTISTIVEPLVSERDLYTEAMKIVRSKPDAIFFSFFQNLDVATKAVKKLGYNGPQLAALIDHTRTVAADGALNGAYYPHFPTAQSDFEERYRKRYESRPHNTAYTGYDAIKLLVEGMRTSHTENPKQIKKTILELDEFEGASGTIRFNNHGGIIKWPEIKRLPGHRTRIVSRVFNE